MKFDLIFNHSDMRTFNRVVYMENLDCILGTPKDSTLNENEEKISVLNQNVTYPYGQVGKVLYPVNIGDYIVARKKVNGTLYLHCYKVISITDTEVICGSVEL